MYLSLSLLLGFAMCFVFNVYIYIYIYISPDDPIFRDNFGHDPDPVFLENFKILIFQMIFKKGNKKASI